jgi:hypothetical protein
MLQQRDRAGKREIVVRTSHLILCQERDLELICRSFFKKPKSDSPASMRSQADETIRIHKRIAQTDLVEEAQSWQNLCKASDRPRDPNNDPCMVLAGINSLNALLAGAGTCVQQAVWHANRGRILCHNHSSFPRLHSRVTVPEEEALPDDFSECESIGDRFLNESPSMSVALLPFFLIFAQLCYSVRHLTRRSALRLSGHSCTRISSLM